MQTLGTSKIGVTREKSRDYVTRIVNEVQNIGQESNADQGQT